MLHNHHRSAAVADAAALLYAHEAREADRSLGKRRQDLVGAFKSVPPVRRPFDGKARYCGRTMMARWARAGVGDDPTATRCSRWSF